MQMLEEPGREAWLSKKRLGMEYRARAHASCTDNAAGFSSALNRRCLARMSLCLVIAGHCCADHHACIVKHHAVCQIASSHVLIGLLKDCFSISIASCVPAKQCFPCNTGNLLGV